MTLEEFLQDKNADLPGIVAAVRASVGLETTDALLAVGSLVEGLGNRKSDLDLILLTKRDPEHLPTREVAVVVGKCLSDLQILPLRKLDELLARFQQWSGLPWDVTYSPSLILEDRRLLHRLVNSVTVFEGADSDFSSLLPDREALARLKLQVARYMARTIQIDLAGNRETEDYPTLVFAAQELLGHAVDALTAGYCLTNPTAKWRSRLLERLPQDWGLHLCIRAAARASQMFWSLHRSPELPDRDSSLEYAYRISTFARAVFVWAERRLVKQKPKPHSVLKWSRMKDAHDPPLPYLDFDVDFVEFEGGVALGRLNEFNQPLVISESDFEIALLFDGVTSATEIKHAIYGFEVTEEQSYTVDRVINLILQAGLCIPAHRSAVA